MRGFPDLSRMPKAEPPDWRELHSALSKASTFAATMATEMLKLNAIAERVGKELLLTFLEHRLSNETKPLRRLRLRYQIMTLRNEIDGRWLDRPWSW